MTIWLRFMKFNFMGLHKYPVSSEAAQWQTYWNNRTVSKIYSYVHDSCIEAQGCEKCERYKEVIEIIIEQ